MPVLLLLLLPCRCMTDDAARFSPEQPAGSTDVVTRWGIASFVECDTSSEVDRVTVLRPTPHKIGHFGDVLTSQSLGVVLKKLNFKRKQQLNKIV